MITREYITLKEKIDNIDALVVLIGGANDTPYSTTLVRYLVRRYGNRVIGYIDKENDTVIKDTVTNYWVDKLSYTYFTTKDKYISLLKIYENNKDKLIQKLSQETKSRFLDTPDSKGDYDSLEHTTTITVNSTETTAGTLMSQIEEIQRYMDNIYNSWISAFNNIFGETIYDKGEL